MSYKVFSLYIVIVFIASITSISILSVYSLKSTNDTIAILERIKAKISSKQNIDDYNEHNYLAIETRLNNLIKSQSKNSEISICFRTLIKPFEGSKTRTGKILNQCTNNDKSINDLIQITNKDLYQNVINNIYSINIGGASLGDIEYVISYPNARPFYLQASAIIAISILILLIIVNKYHTQLINSRPILTSDNHLTIDSLTNEISMLKEEKEKSQTYLTNTIKLLQNVCAKSIVDNTAAFIQYTEPASASRKSKVILIYDKFGIKFELKGSLESILKSKFGDQYIQLNRRTLISTKYIPKIRWQQQDKYTGSVSLYISQNLRFDNLHVPQQFYKYILNTTKSRREQLQHEA